MLLENERRNVWELADAVDDCELNVWIVFCYLLHDRRLCKTNSDDQIEITFGERAHRGLDGVWCAGFDIAQDDWQILRGTLHTFPRSSVEGAIILSADVKNDTDLDLRFVFRSGASAATRDKQSRQN